MVSLSFPTHLGNVGPQSHIRTCCTTSTDRTNASHIASMDLSTAQSCAPSGAFAVLTNHALLSSITQFQHGICQYIRDVVVACKALDHASSKPHLRGVELFWNAALCCGDLASVQLLCRLRHSPEFVDAEFKITNPPKDAAMSGRLDVLQWLHSDGTMVPALWDASILNMVLSYSLRHEEVAHWLLANRPDACATNLSRSMDLALCCEADSLFRALVKAHPDAFTEDLMVTLLHTYNPTLEIIQYLHFHTNVKFFASAMDTASCRGHLDTVRFLHENRSEGGTTYAMNFAASGGHLDVVKFLHEHRSEGCTDSAMYYAAEKGHLAIVQFLHENRTEGCPGYAMDSAAENGHLHVVQFLHQNRTEGCTHDAMDDAAKHGHLDVVQFLHENRSEGCTQKAMAEAAQNGHLQVVQFLHQNRSEGCSPYALYDAARNGHLDVVRFLVENRLEGLLEEALDMASKAGQAEVAKFLVDKLKVVSPTTLLNHFLEQHSMEATRCFHESMNVPFDEASVAIAENSDCRDVYEYVASHLPAGLEIAERASFLWSYSELFGDGNDY